MFDNVAFMKSPDLVVSGHKIRATRELQGLTQEALAKRARIARTTLVNWEVGQRQPSAPGFRALCRALKCQPGDLLVSVGEGEAPEDQEAVNVP